MRKSIKNKLLFLFLLSLFVALSISFMMHTLFFRAYYLNHIENRLMNVYLEIQDNLYQENFEEIISEIDFGQQVGVIIADTDFEYTLFSHILSENTKYHLIYEIRGLIQSKTIDLDTYHICEELYDSVLENNEQIDRMVFVKKLSNGHYCILSHPLEALESNVEAVNQFHISCALIACIFGITSTLIFSKEFTKPIIEINNVTKKMSKLAFKQRIHYNSQDELGELAGNINILSETLEEYKTALEKEVSFQKILSQNMSHELKTPIAVMKGYLEAITYGIADKNGKTDEYISVILNECDQMTELIDQMLQLSKLSSDLEDTLEKSKFSSQDLIDKINHQHSHLLKQESIEFNIHSPPLELWGNQELISQSIGNFITNAVKYGDGNEISLKIEEKENTHLYSLFNSGEPIPDDELPKIFNVFYMVDKARSRKVNSHGLGLSVCKSIAELHSGRVFCENSPSGVTFFMEIPKNLSIHEILPN